MKNYNFLFVLLKDNVLHSLFPGYLAAPIKWGFITKEQFLAYTVKAAIFIPMLFSCNKKKKF